MLGPGALGRSRGIGWKGRWEGGSGWGIHVNPWLIHVNVWQKPLQYCKVISLQLKQTNKQPNPQKAVTRWQRNRKRRPVSPRQFIKRSFECWATPTRQLLNAGRGHQAPRKAAHSFQKEVGQNIKDKGDKRVRGRDPSWGGSCEREASKQ